MSVTVTRPSYFPKNVAVELRKHWGDANLMDLFEHLNEVAPNLPPQVALNIFEHYANDLLRPTAKNGKPMKWNIPLHANPKLPVEAKHIPKINGHRHISGTGLEIYPNAKGEPTLMHAADSRNYNSYPHTPVVSNRHDHKMGITNGAIYVAQTWYRLKNNYLVWGLDQAKGRAMGVASVSADAQDEITELYRHNVRGFRFTGVDRLKDPDDPFDIDKVVKFDRDLHSYGLEGTNMNLYLESADLVKYERQIKNMENPVFLDHCAIPDVFDFQAKKGGSPALRTLKAVLDNNPKNMIKGPGPERIMMANITANLSREKRDEFLAGGFDLSPAVERALKGNDPLDEKIRGEMAVNTKIWDRYVLPLMQHLLIRYPNQFIFGTDAQHPNTTVAVDDGELVNFAVRCTQIEGYSTEDVADLQYRIFLKNAMEAYPGHNFGPDPDYVESDDFERADALWVPKDPAQRLDTRVLDID